MNARWALGLLIGLACFTGCGDDDTSPGAGAGSGSSAGRSGADSGRSGSRSAGTRADADASMPPAGDLGPTAQVRVVNLVPDVTFDAWGRGPDTKAIRLARDIEYATVSDYFDVPLNMLTMHPIFVLWKSGDAPDASQAFSMLLDDTHERARIEVREIEGEGTRATIILEPQEVDGDAPLEYETLDETDANRGDASMLNLHVSYHLFDIGGGAVISAGVEGEPCLIDGSTSVAQVFSVPAGELTFAVYDRQAGGTCGDTDPLATIDLDGDAADNLLVVMYLEDDEVKLLSAPIPEP